MKTNHKLTANHLNNNQINIDRNEVLRYLQCKGQNIDKETNNLINESITEVNEISQPRYVYRIYYIEKRGTIINFENDFLIDSTDLIKTLKNSDKVAVLAATIGIPIEKRIRYYSVTSLSKALVFDSCATSYIEALCDYVEKEINNLANKENLGITFRYSPGYGDLPISHQGEILNSLNAGKLIGLTATTSSILIPRKSVTAFIGLNKSKTPNTNGSSCSSCNLSRTCTFSKEGDICGK